ncbi:MAG: AI-2E family transporter, partial [Acutalibacteraceae bacterium]|nr:AI-2E family transporter [Acutalibacteraceae bacterium]
MNVDFKKRFLIDTAFVVLVVAIMYFLLKFCTLYLLPFVIGLLLAVLVQRPAKFMERKLKIKKSLVSVLFVLVLYLITLLLLSWLGVFIYNKASSFISAAPTYLTTFKDIFGDINARFSDLMTELPPSIASAIETMPDTILKKLTDVLTAVLSSSATIIAKDAPNLLITIIITVVASCYIAKDYDVIMAFLHKHVSSKVNRVISEIKKIFLES